MGIEATYAVNEFVKTKWNAIDSNMVFIPGQHADEGRGDRFVLYKVDPSRDIEFYMVNCDRITYRIVHPDFDTLSKLLDKLLLELNVEDIESLITEPGVRFQMTYAAVNGTGSNYFTDMSLYHYASVDILVKYTLV